MRLVGGFERINEVAGNCDNLRFLMLGFLGDLVKIFGGMVTKMNVADGEDFVFFLIWFIETITSAIEIFHCLYYIADRGALNGENKK